MDGNLFRAGGARASLAFAILGIAMWPQPAGAQTKASSSSTMYVKTDSASPYTTAVGYNALTKNTTNGLANTAAGFQALQNNTSGRYNAATGYQALLNNISGSNNTANGYRALLSNQSGTNNTAIGFGALNTSISASGNTAAGFRALFSTTTGNENTAFGNSALDSNTTGYANTAVGSLALQYNQTGLSNVAMGYHAMMNNKSGSNSTAVGFQALLNNNSSDNTAIGNSVLYSNTSGAGNTGVGSGALQNNSTGGKNTAVGNQALMSNTGPTNPSDPNDKKGLSNTAIGYQALLTNSTGWQNTAVGESVLEKNTIGTHNTAIGEDAMGNNVSGVGNTAAGESSLWTSSVGNFNVVQGYFALNLLQKSATDRDNVPDSGIAQNSGSYNIAVGAHAGCNLTAASASTGNTGNIYVGSLGANNDTGVIRIGNGTQNLAVPDKCKGADTQPYARQTSTYIAGIAGQTVAGGVAVYIDPTTGQLGTQSSSARFKTDIRPTGTTNEKLLKLRPVSFRYEKPDADGGQPLQYGLIAEEVAEVLPELVQYDAEGKPHSVYYQFLPPLLLAEMQRQHAANETLRAEVASLRQQADAQTARLAAIEERLANLKGMTRADAR